MTDTAYDTALAEIAATPVLLVAVDFDGTLAPFADDPLQARMTADARAAIDALTPLADTVVALVSGRSLVDLRLIAEHGDDSPLWLAGSHGVEYWEPENGELPALDDEEHVALRDRLRAEAERLTGELDGVWIEPKTFGLGVHTRRADAASAERANQLVDDLVHAEAPAWRRRTGHSIMEFSFRHEGKDSAVRTLRERTGATAVLFAGDDVTDEDALRTLEPGDLGVRVGDGDTAARVRVPDIDAFAALLSELARLRRSARP
jgi:trehalose 6-phosphate phosphatase